MNTTQLPATDTAPKAPARRPQGGAKAIIQTIGSRILIQLLNAVTGILTARMLMPAGRGQLAAMTLWSLFLAGLTTFGIPSSLIFFLSSRSKQRNDLIVSGLTMATILGVVTGLVGVFFMPHWLHQYPAWLIRDARWLMIVTPLCSLTFVGRAILESHGDFSALEHVPGHQPGRHFRDAAGPSGHASAYSAHRRALLRPSRLFPWLRFWCDGLRHT